MENTKRDILVKDILQVCKGKLVIGEENKQVKKFSKDTRQIEEGDLYVGIKGANFDGNMFYQEALRKGAMGVILNEMLIDEKVLEQYSDKVIILVQDTIQAVQELAAFKRSLYDIPVVAITGSVGKTSTKDIVASVLEEKYNVLKTKGNANNHIGLPFTLLQLDNHEAIVVEMGMNNFGEISVLTNIAKPTMCILTNIGTAHIGNLGSRENILKAKLEILEGLASGGTVIVNNDNDLLHKWAEENKENKEYQIITYGIEENSNYKAININMQEEHSTYLVEKEDKKEKITVPIPGLHFVYNSLCGIAAGEAFQIPMEKIKEGIQHFTLTQSRMSIEKIRDNITIINDAYNANYDSMKSALTYLGSLKNRKIAVLGDMLELGEYSEELHEKVGQEVVKNKIDILITIGNLAKFIAQKAKKEGMKQENIYICETLEKAIKLINEILTKEDAILIKASNSMQFGKIAEFIR